MASAPSERAATTGASSVLDQVLSRDYGPGHVLCHAKLRPLSVTAKAIFERLYLVPGQRLIALFVSMPSAPTPPPLTLRLFLDFRAIFFLNGQYVFLSARFAK